MSESIHPLDDYEKRAKETMSAESWAYLNGGAVDEISVRRNSDRYSEIRLLPRVGVDVSGLDMRLNLIGKDLPSPAALQLLFAEQGEFGTVRGAKTAGTAAVISMESSIATRALSRVAGPFFQHIYAQRDREITIELVRMAEEVGARGIVITLDNPVPGIRYRQDAGMLVLPEGVRRANFELCGVPTLTAGYLDPSITWKDVEWLVGQTYLPVIAKGIMHPEDARHAIDSGVGAVFVSNHGARNLDTIVHPVDCVRAVSDAVAGNVPVLLDGGIRRGTDVLKALALGADLVLVGRPYIWGLAAEGERGVAKVVEILCDELATAMAMCGLSSLNDITPDVVRYHPET